MKRKYLLIGGAVESQHDGQLHYISPLALLKLYNLKKRDCFLASSNSDDRLRGLDLKEFIVLRPRFDGNYTLIDEQK